MFYIYLVCLFCVCSSVFYIFSDLLLVVVICFKLIGCRRRLLCTHDFAFVYILDCNYLTFAAHALFQTKESNSLRERQAASYRSESEWERALHLRPADALLCL